MDKYLDAGLPDIIGRPAGQRETKTVEGYVVPEYLDAEYQQSCAEEWLIGQQTAQEKLLRCAPWACFSLGVCLICVIYAKIGWVELEKTVLLMMAAMAFGGWKVGRMV